MAMTTPEPGVDREKLKIYEAGANHAGFFRTCRLPRCRRAKRCIGRRPGDVCRPDAIDPSLPPCITGDDETWRLIEALRDLARHMPPDEVGDEEGRV